MIRSLPEDDVADGIGVFVDGAVVEGVLFEKERANEESDGWCDGEENEGEECENEGILRVVIVGADGEGEDSGDDDDSEHEGCPDDAHRVN